MVDKKDIINNKHNKRLQKAYSIFDCEAFYSVREALEILQKCSLSAQVKFDESVDVSFNMGVDTKKSDQVVKSFVELSNGNGKKVKILAFADGANIDSALKAGATYAGAEELISDVEQGKIVDFDKCIATPTMMIKLAKIARVLGPKGLMPNAKLGTVSADIATLVTSLKKGRANIITDKDGAIKLGIGRISFSVDSLIQNFKDVYNTIKEVKPSGVKNNYFVNVFITSTMGVGVKVKMSDIYSL